MVPYHWTVDRRSDVLLYAICTRGGHKEYMHKMLTGYPLTDHRDGNGLNNCRCNFREATDETNTRNRRPPAAPKTSRFKGVSWDAARGKWAAQLMHSYKRVHLGRFDDEAAAARAYDRGALEHFGEFALTNEMLGLL